MKINKKKYKVSSDNYYPLTYTKDYIILMDSRRQGMSYHQHLTIKELGKSRSFPAFTIERDGNIHQHYNPKYYGDVIGDRNIDKSSVYICLVNAGNLSNNRDQAQFIDWSGEVVEGDEIVEQRWRDGTHWQTYTEQQYEALSWLLGDLSEKLQVPLEFVGHNALEDSLKGFRGILSRSNLDTKYQDVNPSFNFNKVITAVGE